MKYTLLIAVFLFVGCGDDVPKKQNPTPTPDMGEDTESDDSNNNTDNRAPAFLNLPADVVTTRGTSGSFELQASDPDGDALSFGLVDTDCPFEVQVIATTGRVTWACPAQTVSCEATMSVQDDQGLFTEDQLRLECLRLPPVISSAAPTQATENLLLVYEVVCSDPEMAPVTISKGTNDTCNGTVQQNAYRWTPSTAQAGQTCTLSVECSNGELSSTQSTQVQIRGVNKAPSVSDVRISPTTPSAPGMPLTCLYTFTDPEGDQDQSNIEWFVDNIISGSGETFADYGAGESVTCRVTPDDGELTGPPQTSAPMIFEWPTLIQTDSEYTCIRTKIGSVRCWGHNRSGVIGASSTGFRVIHPPTTPAGLTSNVSHLATGYDFACAVQNSALKCWGDGEIVGQSTHLPTTILNGGVTSISGGLGHMCAVQNGAAKCWGANSLGQIGLGVSNFTNIDVPTTVPGLETGVTKVAVGDFHSCAIHNGGLKCWGDNFSGQLGVSTNFDTFDEIPSPVQVQGLSSNVTDLWAGRNHTCARHNGVVKCFGTNSAGQLGRGSSSDAEWNAAPATVIPASQNQLTLGQFNTCFIDANQARCIGNNEGILLGFQGVSTITPLTVLQPTVTALSIWSGFACAERNDILYCWGRNEYGQLGDGVGTGNGTPQGLTQVNY